jgi:hypothetical protein
MTAGRKADHGSAANVLSASRRRSRDARQVPHRPGLVPGVAILGSQAGLRAVGAPWWILCLLSTLGLAAACLQIVFPQDSPDKVAWWSERRRTQRRYQWRQGCQRRRRCPCQHDSRSRENAPPLRPVHSRRHELSPQLSIPISAGRCAEPGKGTHQGPEAGARRGKQPNGTPRALRPWQYAAPVPSRRTRTRQPTGPPRLRVSHLTSRRHVSTGDGMGRAELRTLRVSSRGPSYMRCR